MQKGNGGKGIEKRTGKGGGRERYSAKLKEYEEMVWRSRQRRGRKMGREGKMKIRNNKKE